MLADGLAGVFWLFLNWGQYFSSPRKMFLTVVNLLVFGIGACLVSFLSFPFLFSSPTVLEFPG